VNTIAKLTYRNIFISVDKVTYSWQLIWPAAWIYIVGFSLANLMSSEVIEISNNSVPYYTFIAIGMMTFNAMNTSEVSGSIIWKDKRNGMLQQLMTMKYSNTQYIISNLLTIVILGLSSSALIGIIGIPAMIGHVNTNIFTIPYFLFALICASIFFGCISIILSCITKNSEQFNIIINGTHYFFTFAAATFYPLKAVPEPLHTIFLFNPMTYFMELTREGIYGVLKSNTFTELLIVAGSTIGIFILAIAVMKRIKF
jgi:ABC-2 type transport system permease protein